MKISLKEAYAQAKRALPGCEITVEVKYGRKNSWDKSGELSVKWGIWATPEDVVQCYDTDEIFSVALAKVAAEVSRAKAKPVEDVVVDDETEKAEVEEEIAETEPTNY